MNRASCPRCAGAKTVWVQVSKNGMGHKTCGLCHGTGNAVCNVCLDPKPHTIRVSIIGRIAKFLGRVCWGCLVLDSAPAISQTELG